MDHIRIYYKDNAVIADIFDRLGDKILPEVLAVEAVADQVSGYTKEWDINGEKVTLAVEKVEE